MTKSKQIDALRGVAILAVIAQHYGYGTKLVAWLEAPAAIAAVAKFGWAGVDLFFVLSAYLLARNLLAHKGETGVATTFYRRRVFRILPLYLFLLALCFLLFPLAGPKSWMFEGLAPLWVYALFAQNFWTGLEGGWPGQFLSPTWSLAVEEHFYLFLPFVMLRVSERGALVAGAAMAILTPFVRWLLASHFGDVAGYAWTICRLDSFGWGLLIALATRQEAAGRRRIVMGWALAFVLSVGAFSFWGDPERLFDPLRVTLVTLMAAGVVAFVVFRAARRTASPAASFFAFFGERCFSFYLLHMPVLGLIPIAFGRGNPQVVDARSALAPLAAFCATTALACLTYRLIERPFIDYGAKHARYGARATSPVSVEATAAAA